MVPAVDLQLGPDGALYIADFYNRIIAHTLVPLGHAERDRERGRIWRVVYTGTGSEARQQVPPTDLTKASLDELLAQLGHSNLVVRTLATHELVDRIGADAVQPVEQMLADRESHAWQRAHGMWVLHRLNALGDKLVAALAEDASPMVRAHVMKVLAERPDWGHESSDLHRLVLAKLADADPFVRRAASDALARHPSPANVQPLLELWDQTPAEDTMLVHVVRMALRDNLRDGESLGEVSQHMSLDDQRRLADVSLGIHTHHTADFLLQHLRTDAFDPTRLAEFMYHIARYADAEVLSRLHSFSLTYRQQDSEMQATVLAALYRATKDRAAMVPPEIAAWALALTGQLLDDADEDMVYQGLELAWELRLTPLAERLEKLADKATPVPALRSFAMDALGAVAHFEAVPTLERMLADATEGTDVRAKAADALGKIDDDASRVALRQRLSAAPAEVAIAIARALSHSRAGADMLLDAVQQGQASARLLQDPLVDQRLVAHASDDLDARRQTLLVDLPSENDLLPSLIQGHRDRFAQATPDVARGAKVFEKHCATCHQIGGKGTQAGPPLDGIGVRGLERILEDILDPHRNVERNFRSTVVQLAQGRIVTGLILREDSDSLVIADADGKQFQISVRDIEDRQQLMLSPMPLDLAKKLPAADFDDLLGYLLSQHEPRQPAGDTD